MLNAIKAVQTLALTVVVVVFSILFAELLGFLDPRTSHATLGIAMLIFGLVNVYLAKKRVPEFEYSFSLVLFAVAFTAFSRM